jgi:hypothetical protein
MSDGYHLASEQSGNRLQVAKFPNQPVCDATTFVTLGVSATPLQQFEGRVLRQEFIFAAKNCDSLANDIAGLLGTVATAANDAVRSYESLREKILRLILRASQLKIEG